MEVRATVLVRRGKAYLPTVTITQAGFDHYMDPVYVADLNVPSLAAKLEVVKSAGNPRVPTPSLEELNHPKQHDPLFRAVGVGTWRKLEEGGAMYAIRWSEKGVRVYVTTPGKRLGDFRYDEDRERNLPPDTPVEEVARVILEDVRSRPELLRTSK